ncbi:uncharacterized protein LOC129591744 [Paramacrobiotus metropolitanus]|uniref:uncharacterized protein LOC129591744 n=1 Tax=Paramacrobiotus metropolitanus TaxID=2943436 RepID=UPI00244632A1|nr:uncharacterized protein LOC129591744 [Paramacrobiotus metropolitanus]
MNVPRAFTPITWKYGAIGAGVALTQGLGMAWYSPQVFGKIWAKYHPVTANTMSKEDHTTSMLISTVADTGFAFLLNYLSSRYFRPLTITDALLLTGIVSGIQLLPQLPHVLWGKKAPEEFIVDHGYNILGIFIKVLALMYMPY